MKKIGFLNTNFGFGPIAKINYIINEFSKGDFELYYFGSGSSLQFLLENQRDIACVEMDTENIKDDDLKKIYEMDLIVNVMNTHFLEKYDEHKVKSVFIDSLAWMWEEKLKGIEKVNAYYVQDYLLNYAKYKDNTSRIIPVITLKKNRIVHNRSDILINFSGMMNPYVESDFFEQYMIFNLDILLSHLSVSQKKIYISK